MPVTSSGSSDGQVGCTLQAIVDETRGKLHLKERDANAFYESSEVKKLKFDELISKMRTDNKKRRVEVSQCITGDEKVIRTVFHHRREELLSMQRYTAEKAVIVMDVKVCEQSNRLNEVRHERQSREQKLEDLENELEQKRVINTTDYDEQRESEIRRIQNEMDKASIKFGAARNITRRYEAIMDKMQEDVRNYPAILDTLEERLKDSKTELAELRRMNEKAIKSSEDARRDLHAMERVMYQAKRARDQQLNETRKDVEKRKEIADRTEKRQRVALISDTSDSRQARLQMQKAERQEKILTLEDAFERIKRAINVSDMDDIVYRLANQGNTFQQLRAIEKEKLVKRNKVLEEINKLRTVFEEMKFTSERQIQKGRIVVEEMAEYLRAAESKCNLTVQEFQYHDKLLINLQSGIATLFEKLKDVQLKPPYHNFANGHPVEDLAQCGRKLDLLLTSLGLKKGLQSALQKIDNQKLHTYLETRLPQDNIRIRIDLDDLSDSDEFHFDHDQEKEGFTSRDDIKRQGQEILNSKLKPKKKKTRKRNA